MLVLISLNVSFVGRKSNKYLRRHCCNALNADLSSQHVQPQVRVPGVLQIRNSTSNAILVFHVRVFEFFEDAILNFSRQILRIFQNLVFHAHVVGELNAQRTGQHLSALQSNRIARVEARKREMLLAERVVRRWRLGDIVCGGCRRFAVIYIAVVVRFGRAVLLFSC